jgi:transcriptional regulator with XRE-family HTH domain
METEQWVEQAHAIWNVLPLHPRPERLESLTSYMIRLAGANGLQFVGELVELAGFSRRLLGSLSRSPDYPVPSYSTALSQIARCPEDRLLHTTFLPLGRRFGRSIHPIALHRFLADSLSSTLRYCPICLASEEPYYSLLWRFLVLPGCIEHGQCFLDRCGHCGSLLPLLSPRSQIAKCVSCQGDLRTGPQKRLSDEILQPTQRRTHELSTLLSPMSGPLDLAQARMIGKRCMALRQQKDLSITEVASLSGVPIAVIVDIEQTSHRMRASFSDYMRYADALSCSLLEVFDMDLIPIGEDLALKQVESAIQQLMRQGEPVTRKNIRDLVGMEIIRLGHYQKVDALLAKQVRGQTHQSTLMKTMPEEEVVKRVEQAIEALKASGRGVSQRRICELVGMSRTELLTYPRVHAQFKQIAQRRFPHDLTGRVQNAVNQAQALGIGIGYRSISEMTGISKPTLISNELVRALIQRAQNEVRELRINALVNRVEHAIEELTLRGEKASLRKVSRLMGVDHSSLRSSPPIRELFLSLR